MSKPETAVKPETSAPAKRGRKERAGFDIPANWTRKNVEVTVVKNSAAKGEPSNAVVYNVGVPQAPDYASAVSFLTAQKLDPQQVMLAAFNARNLTFAQAGANDVKKAYGTENYEKAVSKAQRRVGRSVFTGKVRSGISQAKKAAFGEQVAAAIAKGATMADIAKMAAELGLAPSA